MIADLCRRKVSYSWNINFDEVVQLIFIKRDSNIYSNAVINHIFPPQKPFTSTKYNMSKWKSLAQN